MLKKTAALLGLFLILYVGTFLLLVAVAITLGLGGGEAELRHRFASLCIACFWIPTQIADENDLINPACHR